MGPYQRSFVKYFSCLLGEFPTWCRFVVGKSLRILFLPLLLLWDKVEKPFSSFPRSKVPSQMRQTFPRRTSTSTDGGVRRRPDGTRPNDGDRTLICWRGGETVPGTGNHKYFTGKNFADSLIWVKKYLSFCKSVKVTELCIGEFVCWSIALYSRFLSPSCSSPQRIGGRRRGIDRPIFQNADGSDFLRENWRRGESIFWVGVPLSFLLLLVVSLWWRKECPYTFWIELIFRRESEGCAPFILPLFSSTLDPDWQANCSKGETENCFAKLAVCCLALTVTSLAEENTGRKLFFRQRLSF